VWGENIPFIFYILLEYNLQFQNLTTLFSSQKVCIFEIQMSTNLGHQSVILIKHVRQTSGHPSSYISTHSVTWKCDDGSKF
jgi:hypothetical protein